MQKANIIHQDTCKSEYGKTFDQTDLSFNRSKVDPRAIQAAENDEVILYCKVNKTKIPQKCQNYNFSQLHTESCKDFFTDD